MAPKSSTAAPDLTFDLVSLLYHALQATRASARYQQQAQEAGERAQAAYFRDCQQQQRELAERAKNLLAARLGRPTARAAAARRAGPHALPLRELRTQTNASVKSGGQPGDSQVDELSKESFPASDAPATY